VSDCCNPLNEEFQCDRWGYCERCDDFFSECISNQDCCKGFYCIFNYWDDDAFDHGHCDRKPKPKKKMKMKTGGKKNKKKKTGGKKNKKKKPN
jgi:hypothetical protein